MQVPVPLTLTEVARAGFQDLSEARTALGELAAVMEIPAPDAAAAFSRAADPDAALVRIRNIGDSDPGFGSRIGVHALGRLALLTGASPALGDFFTRHPEHLCEILDRGGRLFTADEARAAFAAAVTDEDSGVLAGEPGWNAMRVAYREALAEVMLYDLRSGIGEFPEACVPQELLPLEDADLESGDIESGQHTNGALGSAAAVFESVAASLSGLADAAVETALMIGRQTLSAGGSGPHVPAERLAALQLGVVAMGKCGAQELNVVSDVDVMFIVDTRDSDVLDVDATIRIGTRLASEIMRAIHDPAIEPPLWQVDANLRPEGRHGALVRTPGSMLAYYDRWAKAWEFQALLKARPMAGDLALGETLVAGTHDAVWASAAREDFVGSVQRMRTRVTEHIADHELEVQLKLGPGGLRDIEFSVQLLQLVHGQYDERIHQRGTLPALRALVAGGYIARSDGERLAGDYRRLRILEHRLQLRDLRRTALMPTDTEGLRVLARASRVAATGTALMEEWSRTKREVRELHLKIFYAPLLSAVAALPEEELVLGTDAARARLSTIGFRDPEGAMRHIAALTRGTSRRSRIQRNLMPVLLQWLAEGTDPDFGLRAFRRVSEGNRESPWYLRLLRDGTEAAERLTRVLSCSRFTADLLESTPDAVAWLEQDALLRPTSLEALREEMRSLASRRAGVDAAATALRTVHRREVLRLALGRLSGVTTDADVAAGLDAAHTALLDALLRAIRAGSSPTTAHPLLSELKISLIGMGRYGGGELGFASDIDVVAVFQAPEGLAPERASREAIRIISELRRLVSDPRFSVDLDFDLRPEGKNGPLARSIAAYRSYYERWSVTWEAQALLRARAVAGDVELGAAFISLADQVRFPPHFNSDQVREVRRIKARVESERLPQGADPRRHLKLGPGGISDVEWLVQLIQLRDAYEHPALRTVSTLTALDAAAELGLLGPTEVEQLRASWEFASSVRSAVKLWSGKSSDSLPMDWGDLAGIAAILDLPTDRTTELEEKWFTLSRRTRAVFDQQFFGYSEEPDPFAHL